MLELLLLAVLATASPTKRQTQVRTKNYSGIKLLSVPDDSNLTYVTAIINVPDTQVVSARLPDFSREDHELTLRSGLLHLLGYTRRDLPHAVPAHNLSTRRSEALVVELNVSNVPGYPLRPSNVVAVHVRTFRSRPGHEGANIIAEIHNYEDAFRYTGEIGLPMFDFVGKDVTVRPRRLLPALAGAITFKRRQAPRENPNLNVQKPAWLHFAHIISHVLRRNNGTKMTRGTIWGLMMISWMGGLLNNDERLPEYLGERLPGYRENWSTFEEEVGEILEFVVYRAVQMEQEGGNHDQQDDGNASEESYSDDDAGGQYRSGRKAKAPKILGQQWIKNIGEVWKAWR